MRKAAIAIVLAGAITVAVTGWAVKGWLADLARRWL